MSTTKVQRGLGDKPGADVSSPLLTHERARLARGAYLLDSNQGGAIRVEGSGYYIGLPAPGSLVQLTLRGGRRLRGMLDESEVVFDRVGVDPFTADTNLVMEMEVEREG